MWEAMSNPFKVHINLKWWKFMQHWYRPKQEWDVKPTTNDIIYPLNHMIISLCHHKENQIGIYHLKIWNERRTMVTKGQNLTTVNFSQFKWNIIRLFDTQNIKIHEINQKHPELIKATFELCTEQNILLPSLLNKVP